MQPEATPTAVLRARLSAALEGREPRAWLQNETVERLARYAHELAFEGDRAEVDAPDAEGWIAETTNQGAIRRYLVAHVLIHEADRWFPELLKAAARWRSHLAPDEQADVTMLLVASDDDALGRVAVLERNEAFAQVHIWIPGPNPAEWQPEADLFLKRLRLGPIEGRHDDAGQDLSPVDAIFEGIPKDLRERWRKVLMDKTFKESERARQLLAVADESSGGSDGQ